VPVSFTGSIKKPALFEAHFLAEDVSKITTTIVSWDDKLQDARINLWSYSWASKFAIAGEIWA